MNNIEELRFNQIIEKLECIEKRLSTIEANQGIVIDKNKKVEEDCSKMREHINFIENTYSAVRSPLSYIKNKIDFVMGNEVSYELPLLEYEEK